MVFSSFFRVVAVIVRLIFYGVLIGAIYYALKGLFGGEGDARRGYEGEGEPSADAMIPCPECETYFPAGIGVSGRIRGKKYLFCSEECLRSFRSRGGPPPKEGPSGNGNGQDSH